MGCKPHEKLPTYPRLSAVDSLAILRQRAHQIRTVSATGTISLTRSSNQSIRLDGAVAMQPPERFRIRAWKLSQAIFDITLNPQGIWLLSSSDPSRAGEIRKGGAGAAVLARTVADLTGRLFDSSNLTFTSTPEAFVFTQQKANGSTLRCRVDRRTLTARQYVMLDPSGKERFILALDDFALRDNIPFPRSFLATSEKGVIRIDLRDIEINSDLPPGAFDPPARAEKLSP